MSSGGDSAPCAPIPSTLPYRVSAGGGAARRAARAVAAAARPGAAAGRAVGVARAAGNGARAGARDGAGQRPARRGRGDAAVEAVGVVRERRRRKRRLVGGGDLPDGGGEQGGAEAARRVRRPAEDELVAALVDDGERDGDGQPAAVRVVAGRRATAAALWRRHDDVIDRILARLFRQNRGRTEAERRSLFRFCVAKVGRVARVDIAYCVGKSYENASGLGLRATGNVS